MKKNELKLILDHRLVDYKYNATLNDLKELVLTTNPE
jgi:hypothetical protein